MILRVNAKEGATHAIERAQYELEQALARLAEVPSVDSDRLTYAAHALNNYLMVVSAITHVLRVGMSKMSDAEAAERLDALKHATHLMKQVVRQFQGARQENGPALLFLPVDLRIVVAAACDEYDPLGAEKHISLIRDLPAAAVMVWTDRIALGAVLDNVLSNAVKYSSHGGTVRIAVHRTSQEGVCAISDAGPGISEAEAQRVFTRGGTLSSRPTAGEASTGYGLAIAKDFVNALGGRLWFANEPAGGATFSVAVPLFDNHRHSADPPRRRL